MRRLLKEKSFADVMEERIKNDPTLRQPSDAAVPYSQRGMPRKLDKAMWMLIANLANASSVISA